MKKYLYIYKATLIENLNYISSVIIRFFNFVVMMFVFINLWQYIYSDSSQIINGYTMEQMIWYVLITEALWFGSRNKILTTEISEDIKTGNIAYNINKPYNYIFYIIAKHLGEITIKFIVFLILGIILGIIFVGPINNFNFMNIPFITISLILRSNYKFYIKNSYKYYFFLDRRLNTISLGI